MIPAGPISPPPQKAVYVWAVVILTLLSVVLTLGILYLRPGSDPLDVIGNVAKGAAPTIAAVLAFLKSQETHLSVNSRLDAFMAEHAKNAHAEGVLQGTADEQARIARTTVSAGAIPPTTAASPVE